MNMYPGTETPEALLPCSRTEAGVLRDHPEWLYLSVGGPVRPPTDEEQARYEARYEDPDWRDLYGQVNDTEAAPEAAGVPG